jgi:tripartite-type tricarboxylate transporter receptor subunit TctC
MMLMRNVMLGVLGGLLAVTAADAQTFPTRPVTMYVTAAAGGVTDVVARAVGAKLSELWGQPVVIENKGGAAHIIGAQQVAKAAPDGHTLLAAESGTYVLNPTFYPPDRLGYVVGKDIIPITGLVRINQAIIASNDLPVSDIAELIALAKQKPGKLTYGTASLGSAPHMNMLKFERMADVKLQAVHYRGASPALTDVMAGHINLMSVSTSLSVPAHRDHRVKMLGVGSLQRRAQIADLPTVAETVPGYEAVTWFGLATTGGTPPDVIRKISADVQKVMNDPEFRTKFLEPQMFEPMAETPEQFADYVKRETENWAKIIAETHLTIN